VRTVHESFEGITLADSLRWRVLHPEQDELCVSKAQADLDLAQTGAHTGSSTGRLHIHGAALLTLRGATDPPALWLKGLRRDASLEALHKHVATLGATLCKELEQIDVVSNVLEWRAGAFRLTRNAWLVSTAGDDVVPAAFHSAAESCPTSTLWLDEGLDCADEVECEPYLTALHEYVGTLLEQGVPVHGVGLALHQVIFDDLSVVAAPHQGGLFSTRYRSISPRSLAKWMDKLASLGLRVRVSALDVEVRLEADAEPRAERDALLKQAEVFGGILSACLSTRACEEVTVWGVSDDMPPPPLALSSAPLLWDTQHREKPSHAAVVQALWRGRVPLEETPYATLFTPSARSANLEGDGRLVLSSCFDMQSLYQRRSSAARQRIERAVGVLYGACDDYEFPRFAGANYSKACSLGEELVASREQAYVSALARGLTVLYIRGPLLVAAKNARAQLIRAGEVCGSAWQIEEQHVRRLSARTCDEVERPTTPMLREGEPDNEPEIEVLSTFEVSGVLLPSPGLKSRLGDGRTAALKAAAQPFRWAHEECASARLRVGVTIAPESGADSLPSAFSRAALALRALGNELGVPQLLNGANIRFKGVDVRLWDEAVFTSFVREMSRSRISLRFVRAADWFKQCAANGQVAGRELIEQATLSMARVCAAYEECLSVDVSPVPAGRDCESAALVGPRGELKDALLEVMELSAPADKPIVDTWLVADAPPAQVFVLHPAVLTETVLAIVAAVGALLLVCLFYCTTPGIFARVAGCAYSVVCCRECCGSDAIELIDELEYQTPAARGKAQRRILTPPMASTTLHASHEGDDAYAAQCTGNAISAAAGQFGDDGSESEDEGYHAPAQDGKHQDDTQQSDEADADSPPQVEEQEQERGDERAAWDVTELHPAEPPDDKKPTPRAPLTANKFSYYEGEYESDDFPQDPLAMQISLAALESLEEDSAKPDTAKIFRSSARREHAKQRFGSAKGSSNPFHTLHPEMQAAEDPHFDGPPGGGALD